VSALCKKRKDQSPHMKKKKQNTYGAMRKKGKVPSVPQDPKREKSPTRLPRWKKRSTYPSAKERNVSKRGKRKGKRLNISTRLKGGVAQRSNRSSNPGKKRFLHTNFKVQKGVKKENQYLQPRRRGHRNPEQTLLIRTRRGGRRRKRNQSTICPPPFLKGGKEGLLYTRP